jgi:serine/threonine protein kinase
MEHAPPPQNPTFKFLRNLAEGAYGKVMLFENTTTKETFAVKQILPQDNIQQKNALRNEISLLEHLDHKSVVKLHNLQKMSFITEQQKFELSHGNPTLAFFALEFCEFGSFEKAFGNKTLPEKILKFYFWQALKALEYIHGQGCWHLDVKPGNLLLGESLDLKLADFGCAIMEPVTAGTLERVTVKNMSGTEGFRGPEVKWNAEYCPVKADIFSLAAAMFRIFTDRNPFSGTHEGDSYWKYICVGIKRMFFGRHHNQVHNKHYEFKMFSEELMDLLFEMWNPDPL